MSRSSRDVVTAIAWAAGITALERAARSSTERRADGWLRAYPVIAAVAALAPAPPPRATPSRGRLALLGGATLASTGYPLGRALVGDQPVEDAPGGFRELAALGAVVPVAEELAWGRQVERRIGPMATALLFAVKHPLVDGRWRRVPGLAACWLGLAVVRRRSPLGAAALHCSVNTGGVVLGHVTGRDQF